MKPIKVYYPAEGDRIVKGQAAFVGAEPSGEYVFITTEVLEYNSQTGEFETNNSRYVPVAQPDSSVVQ